MWVNVSCRPMYRVGQCIMWAKYRVGQCVSCGVNVSYVGQCFVWVNVWCGSMYRVGQCIM